MQSGCCGVAGHDQVSKDVWVVVVVSLPAGRRAFEGNGSMLEQ